MAEEEVVPHMKTQEGGGGGCPTCEDIGRGGGGCPTCEDIGRGGEVVPHMKTQEGGGRLSHM